MEQSPERRTLPSLKSNNSSEFTTAPFPRVTRQPKPPETQLPAESSTSSAIAIDNQFGQLCGTRAATVGRSISLDRHSRPELRHTIRSWCLTDEPPELRLRSAWRPADEVLQGQPAEEVQVPT